MASMIDKVMENTNDVRFGDLEECISEACLTYEGMGRLFGELLEYFGGSGDHDIRAAAILEGMMREYIADAM